MLKVLICVLAAGLVSEAITSSRPAPMLRSPLGPATPAAIEEEAHNDAQNFAPRLAEGGIPANDDF